MTIALLTVMSLVAGFAATFWKPLFGKYSFRFLFIEVDGEVDWTMVGLCLISWASFAIGFFLTSYTLLNLFSHA